MPYATTDTIAAIATAPGSGGIAIVRLSGPLAPAILTRLFVPASGAFAGFRPYTLHRGMLTDVSGQPLDEVLAVVMPGPRSFTGEDVAEIHCHGGAGVTREVLGAVLAAGARQAERGEFTYRAFLNGRMDLAQAEAVAELIGAPTRAAADAARSRLGGLLSERVRGLRERLEALRAQVCLAVDFPEEELECLDRGDFDRGVDGVRAEVADLIAAAGRGRVAREGAVVVLAGRVNAGKSSLLNALLGRDRAIVADTPGTTRDFIEEGVELGGVTARLVDTAGLRGADEGAETVELLGVARGRELLAAADLIVLVTDASGPLHEVERELVREAGPERLVAALNKMDVAAGDMPARAEAELARMGVATARIAARTGTGVTALAEFLGRRLLAGDGEPAPVTPNARQATALTQALAELEGLCADVAAGVPYDLCGVRLEAACAALAEVTGEIAPQDVLDAIFTRFCIGK